MKATRRAFALGALLAGTVGTASTRAATPMQIPLWDGMPPGGGGPDGVPLWSRTGSVTNVVEPTVSVYRPARPNGAAMLIAAGGGYRHIEMGKEAIPAAMWLSTLGITAFVLTYRLPPEGWRSGRMAPFQDAQRALRLIRARAAEFGLDPRRVGALGFSAGAHLLGMQSARAGWQTYATRDAIDAQSDAFNATLLIYPIVTLLRPYQHTATRRVLIGDDPSAEESAAWSVQTHIHADEAPFFLVQAADDPISDPANSAILEGACQSAGVAVERHLFPTGGHGFGLGRPGTDTVNWPQMATAWMQKYRFIS